MKTTKPLKQIVEENKKNLKNFAMGRASSSKAYMSRRFKIWIEGKRRAYKAGHSKRK